MKEIERACDYAEQIQRVLSEAITLAEEMKGSMGRLAPEELFAAAHKRELLNAQVTQMTAELGDVLHQLARQQGWQEMTMARLTAFDPVPAARLRAALAEVNARATTLRNQDAANRARGSRALAFLRSALAPHTSGSSAYDRRGAAAAAARPISTASRTV